MQQAVLMDLPFTNLMISRTGNMLLMFSLKVTPQLGLNPLETSGHLKSILLMDNLEFITQAERREPTSSALESAMPIIFLDLMLILDNLSLDRKGLEQLMLLF